MPKKNEKTNTQKKSEAQKNVDKEEQSNLVRGFEMAKEDYIIANDKFKSADEKLNMILVFNAALLATLFFVLPIHVSCTLLALCYVLLALFIVGAMTSIVSVIVGMFPTSYAILSPDIYTKPETYQKTEIEFQAGLIATYQISIKQLSKKTTKKVLCAKISFITSLVSVFFIITLFILSNI